MIGTHGTAVASVIAGRQVGVAPGALVVPVKIANCNSTAELLWWCWGVDWIASEPTDDIQTGNPYRHNGRGVINMSILIDADNSWDVNTPIGAFEHAVQNVLAAGFVVVASANNQNNSNCTTSPARLGYNNYDPWSSEIWRSAPHRVITVGGTDEQDRRWLCSNQNDCPPDGTTPGSNAGRCVDLYAPAHNVMVAHFGGDCVDGQVCYRAPGWPSSGTSFAAPAVAGYAARLLQANPWMSVVQVRDQIISDSTPLPPNFDGDGVAANDRILFAWPSK